MPPTTCPEASVEEWAKKDPIRAAAERMMLERDWADRVATSTKLQRGIRARDRRSRRVGARTSPYPDPADAARQDVYDDGASG